MSDLTYEFETSPDRLETYEWDNVWWEHAKTEGVPRVLYIGDSISYSTRRVATSASGGTIYFDGFGTSKAVDNPYFKDSVRMFAKQQRERRVVLFNNGLHGWHLSDETEYARYYEEMICFLLEEFRDTPLMLLLTTHVANPAREQRVIARNRVVSALAQKYSLPVIDLYSLTKAHEELLSKDGVHWEKEGYQLLAEELVKNVKTYITESF